MSKLSHSGRVSLLTARLTMRRFFFVMVAAVCSSCRQSRSVHVFARTPFPLEIELGIAGQVNQLSVPSMGISNHLYLPFGHGDALEVWTLKPEVTPLGKCTIKDPRAGGIAVEIALRENRLVMYCQDEEP